MAYKYKRHVTGSARQYKAKTHAIIIEPSPDRDWLIIDYTT